MDLNDALYRHERLVSGALAVPNTVHMHFELGPHRDVQRRLYEKLVRYGATPKESVILEPSLTCLVSCPVAIPPEVASLGLPGFRMLDDADIEPCSARLERVIARLRPDGQIETAGPIDLSLWRSVSTGYVASYSDAIEIHHTVCFPKQGSTPPISLQELAARAQGMNIESWSLFLKDDAWCFRSTLSLQRNGDFSNVLQRDAAKLATILDGFALSGSHSLRSSYIDVAPEMRISITVEETITVWDYSFKLADGNLSRKSKKQVFGTSVRRLPNLADVVAQCKAAPVDKILVHGEADRLRIINHIEPFRRIAINARFDPLVIGIGLIHATERPGRPDFADHFCSQVAAYGETREEAETLVEAYRAAMHYLVQSGSGPIAAYDDRYEEVDHWASILPGANSAKEDAAKAPRIIAAGERVFTIASAPPKQPKTIEEILHTLTSTLGLYQNPRLRNAGFLFIPFRVENRASGETLRGAMFALVSSTEMNLHRMEILSLRERPLLERCPFGSTQPASSEPIETPTLRSVRERQIHEHARLRTALCAVFHEPKGRRVALMFEQFREMIDLFKRYPGLENFRDGIERASSLKDLTEECWTAMTDLERSSLYKTRVKFGLPSLKNANPPKRKNRKTTNKTRKKTRPPSSNKRT